MNYPFLAISMTIISLSQISNAQANLLENVKRDPNEAIDLCQRFKELNKNNISASSAQSLKKISDQKNISEIDAEILSMYVRGLYCSEVF